MVVGDTIARCTAALLLRIMDDLRRVLPAALVLAFGVNAAFSADAETRVQTEINSTMAAIWTGEDLGMSGVSQGIVDFRSGRDRNVQGRLQLRLTVFGDAAPAAGDGAGTNTDESSTEETDTANAGDGGLGITEFAFLEVPRASVRFRFPLTEDYTMRVTTGRDRLSWGIGALFNAGDLIFGSDGSDTADLTVSEDVRDETAWLLSMYFPLGDLGYLETVTLPSAPVLPSMPIPPSAQEESPDSEAADQDLASSVPAPISEVRTGLRVHGAFGPVTLEPAWIYDGAAEVHRMALTAQAGFGADFYGAAALHLPETGPERGMKAADVLEEYSAVSAGVLYSFSPAPEHTLSTRLEVLLQPGAHWSDKSDREAVYALHLYPELIWSAGRTVQVIGRGIVSPIDLSAEITTGVSWNVFQNFYALAFGSMQAGSDTAVYGWDRRESAAASVGFRYLF